MLAGLLYFQYIRLLIEAVVSHTAGERAERALHVHPKYVHRTRENTFIWEINKILRRE